MAERRIGIVEPYSINSSNSIKSLMGSRGNPVVIDAINGHLIHRSIIVAGNGLPWVSRPPPTVGTRLWICSWLSGQISDPKVAKALIGTIKGSIKSTSAFS